MVTCCVNRSRQNQRHHRPRSATDRNRRLVAEIHDRERISSTASYLAVQVSAGTNVHRSDARQPGLNRHRPWWCGQQERLENVGIARYETGAQPGEVRSLDRL
jgi:hypothetical protein